MIVLKFEKKNIPSLFDTLIPSPIYKPLDNFKWGVIVCSQYNL